MKEIEKYNCEKCNKEASGNCCRHCGYLKSEGKFISEIRNTKKVINEKVIEDFWINE